MNESKLIVISGGPGAGKTTLLEELRRRGYTCSAEVARKIIQEQVASDGRAVPWDDREEYSKLMLLRSIDSWQEHAAAQGTIFFDRGIPDALCYVRLVGLSSQLGSTGVGNSWKRRMYFQRSVRIARMGS